MADHGPIHKEHPILSDARDLAKLPPGPVPPGYQPPRRRTAPPKPLPGQMALIADPNQVDQG